MSKRVQGYVETVGRSGGDVKRTEEGEGEEKKGCVCEKMSKALKQTV